MGDEEDAKQFNEIAENLKKSHNFDYNSQPISKNGQYSDKSSFKNQLHGFRRQNINQSRASSIQSHHEGRSVDADDSETITGSRHSTGGVKAARKSVKSRQEGELTQSFGTERATLDKSALRSGQTNITDANDEPDKPRNGQSTQRPTGYKRNI